MEIRQLKHFIETAKCGNLSRASESSFISVQGISMSIIRLEDEFGLKLFSRSVKGVTLTEAGQYLLPRAEDVVSIIGDCEKHFSDAINGQRAASVMFSRGSIEEFAGAAINSYMEKYPDIKLQIHECSDAECENAVAAGKIELALCAGPIDTARFDATPLFTDQNTLVVNECHPLANRDTVTIKGIENVQLVLQRMSAHTTSTLFDLCKAAGFTPNVSTFVDDYLLAVYLAGQNKCGFIAPGIIANGLCRPGLRAIPFEESEMLWRIYLIKRKGAKLSSEAKAFERTLLEQSVKINSQSQYN